MKRLALPKGNHILLTLISLLLTQISCYQSFIEQEKSDESIVAPLPDYLLWVYPNVGAKIESDVYKSDVETTKRPIPNSLCIILSPASLIESTEKDLSIEEYLSRSELIIDGEVMDTNRPDFISDGLDVQTYLEIDEDTGGVLSIQQINNLGPYTLCWLTNDLDIGLHTIHYEYTKPSRAKESYRWVFRITK